MNVSRPDPKLPMFVYGSLKSDEIAWPQIQGFVVDVKPKVLLGYVLQISDGVAYAKPRANHSVKGELLIFSNSATAYQKISEFEGTFNKRKRYNWVVIEVDGVRANLLEQVGSPATYREAPSWSLVDDEVFEKGVPWIHTKIEQSLQVLGPYLLPSQKTDEYWDSYFQLQSCVLFLWGIQERLEFFRFGMTSDRHHSETGGSERTISTRRAEMEADKLFAKAVKMANIDVTLKVFSYRDPTGLPWKADSKPLSAWYEVRNNITHHAKGSEKEVKKVVTAAIDHLNTLVLYMSELSPRLADKWGHLTTIEKSV